MIFKSPVSNSWSVENSTIYSGEGEPVEFFEGIKREINRGLEYFELDPWFETTDDKDQDDEFTEEDEFSGFGQDTYTDNQVSNNDNQAPETDADEDQNNDQDEEVEDGDNGDVEEINIDVDDGTDEADGTDDTVPDEQPADDTDPVEGGLRVGSSSYNHRSFNVRKELHRQDRRLEKLEIIKNCMKKHPDNITLKNQASKAVRNLKNGSLHDQTLDMIIS